MHTPKEYDNNKTALEEEEKVLKELEQRIEESRKRIQDLKLEKAKMYDSTLGEIAFQKQHEANIEDSKKYSKEITQLKEKFKDNEPVRLDRLTPHYMGMIERLSKKRQSILWFIVRAGKPLSSKEIAQKLNRSYGKQQINSSNIAATLNGDGMKFIPKNKSHEFQIFERGSDGKIAVCKKDPDFLPFLEMRWGINKYAA